jgi:hypothetical protein
MWRNKYAPGVSAATPFMLVTQTQEIQVSASSVNPLTTGASQKYVIPAGTPMAPVSGKYLPVRRTRIVATAPSNSATVYVDDATPFVAGDRICYFNSYLGTGAVGTVSTSAESGNVLVLAAAITAAAGDYLEEAYTGAHANTTSAMTEEIRPTDHVILLHDVSVTADDGVTTVDASAVGVTVGQMRSGSVKGTGCATFDVILRQQFPHIQFLNTQAGT